MNDYSDLIYLMAAIIVFSMLSMQVSQSIFRNNMVQAQSSVEYHAIAHAQDYIDKIQFVRSPNDLETWAQDFPRTDSVMYDHANELFLPFLIDVSIEDTTLQGANINSKYITLSVKSQYLDNQNSQDAESAKGITKQFIKSFD